MNCVNIKGFAVELQNPLTQKLFKVNSAFP